VADNKLNAAELRTKAEARVASLQADAEMVPGEFDVKRLLHELQVHQVELEMQNDELRLANQALREHDLHIQNVIKMTPAGYFHLDCDECFVDVNDAWLQMHGYEFREEVIGKHFSLVQVDSGSNLAHKHLAELHNGLPIPFGEFSGRRKDGSIGHHIFSAHPVLEAGRVAGFEWFIIDISERRMTDDILQARARMREYAFQHTMNEVLANALDEAEALTGSTIGFFHFLAADQKNLILQAWSSNTLSGMCQAEGKGQHYSVDQAGVWADCVHLRQPVIHNDYAALPNRKGMPQGHAAVVRELVVPIFRGGMIVAILGIGNKPTDYTEQDVNMVSQLADLAWDIVITKKGEEEKLVLQQQFQQAQKLESLGVLAGGIAHDFNNILTVIISSCSLAQLRPNMVPQLLPEIEKAAQRAAELCRQMLTYAGKSIMTMKQVKLAALVEDMIRMLKATINRNVVITSDFAADLPAICGDASQLRQIVMNLIINASEAIAEEHGEIRIKLAAATVVGGQSEQDHLGMIIPAGQYVCLEVTDSGCGMDDETRQRIFEPFYTTKFTGRGLGMSAVLGIIAAHKGALQLYSQPGQGTTFKVYLPVQCGLSNADLPLPYVPLMPWQGSGTVLLVEDEPQITMVAKSLTEALGFTVIEASNGREALELSRQNAEEITLVITDIGMPQMDGYELFNKLKELAPGLPIVISSGFGDVIATSRMAAGQVAGFLNKPYSFDQLQEILKKIVDP